MTDTTLDARPSLTKTGRTILRSRITAHPDHKNYVPLGANGKPINCKNLSLESMLDAAEILEFDLPTSSEETDYNRCLSTMSGKSAMKVVNFNARIKGSGGKGLLELPERCFSDYNTMKAEADKNRRRKERALAKESSQSQETNNDAPEKCPYTVTSEQTFTTRVFPSKETTQEIGLEGNTWLKEEIDRIINRIPSESVPRIVQAQKSLIVEWD